MPSISIPSTNDVINGANNAFNKGKDLASDAYDKGKDIASSVYDKGKDIASDAYDKMTDKYYDNRPEDLDPDVDKSFAEIMSNYGLYTEEYEVITDDGYILKLFRIYNPSLYKKESPVVFL
jgi:hypothetical protein